MVFGTIAIGEVEEEEPGARVYLQRMINVVKNRVGERYASFMEAKNAVHDFFSKRESLLSASLSAAFSQFSTTVLSHTQGFSSCSGHDVARPKRLAPKCERFEAHQEDPDEGWESYHAHVLDKGRPSFRSSDKAGRSMQMRVLPFGYGGERLAFLCRFPDDPDRLLVAKELRSLAGKSGYQLYERHAEEYQQKLLEAHQIVDQLTRAFTQELQQIEDLDIPPVA